MRERGQVPSFPRLPAARVYLGIEATTGLFFATITTLNLVYEVTVVHLDPLELVLVGTVLEATIFFGEVPTGILADTVSRRLSVLVGLFLTGLGFLLEAWVPSFRAVLLAQVVWGLGATFMSGALEAWIADEVGEAEVGALYVRGAQLSEIGSSVGVLLSVLLGARDVRVPLFVGGAGYLLLTACLSLTMPETRKGATSAPASSHERSMMQILKEALALIAKRPALLVVLVAGGAYAIFTEGYDRLWTPHWLTFALPSLGPLPETSWFAILHFGGSLLTLALTEWTRRNVDLTSSKRMVQALLAFGAAMIVPACMLALSHRWLLALVAIISVAALRRAYRPIFMTFTNRSIESGVRATVLSLANQVDALGQLGGGPVLGAIAKARGLRFGLLASASTLLALIGVFVSALRGSALRELSPPSEDER